MWTHYLALCQVAHPTLKIKNASRHARRLQTCRQYVDSNRIVATPTPSLHVHVGAMKGEFKEIMWDLAISSLRVVWSCARVSAGWRRNKLLPKRRKRSTECVSTSGVQTTVPVASSATTSLPICSQSVYRRFEREMATPMSRESL